jgi:DNA-binding YbaB/EbfC family protein
MFNKLKQIQDLRKKAKELQNNLAQDLITSESEWGKIKITMNGNQQVQEVKVDETLLSAENKEKLENGLKEAYNKAIKDVQMLMARKIQSGDIDMPNIPGLN